MYGNGFVKKNHALNYIMWKNIVESDRWKYNMAQAHWMLNNSGYKHTLRKCNPYVSSTATLVHEFASMLRYTYTPRLVLQKNLLLAL
jgi:hypothetical protein